MDMETGSELSSGSFKVIQKVEANLVLDLGFLTSISALFPLVLAASLLAGDKTAVGRALPL